ncbi:DUF6326 family protein [Flavobacteriaceae bacterium M23B6Z8]
MLQNPIINIRIKLALLWTTMMALYIYADFFNLMTPNTLEEMMTQETPDGPITPMILVIYAVLLIIPALLIPASVFLKPIWSKWLNIIFAVIYGLLAVFIVITEISNVWRAFFVVYQAVEIALFAFIIYLAWNWPKKEPLAGNT